MKTLKTNNSFDIRHQKLYQFMFVVLLVGIIVVINATLNKLPLKFTQIDISSNSLYSLSEQSTELLSSLDEKIDIYLVSTDSGRSAIMEKLLARYEDGSPWVSVEYIDPDLYPTFTEQYTDIVLNDNSVIVVSGRAHYVIDYSSMVTYTLDSSTGTASNLVFDAEGLITSGIRYVVSSEFPVLYQLTGHGELPASDFFLDSIEKNNILLSDINLLTVSEMPENASCLLINSPSSDISENEAQIIREYLNNGGNLFLILSYNSQTSNLNALLEEYGVHRTQAVVLESDPSYYIQGYPSFLLPASLSFPAGFSFNNSVHVLLPLAEGLTLDTELGAFPVLMSSDSSFAKADFSADNYNRETDDLAGPFALVAGSTDGNSKLLCFSTSQILNADINELVSGGNSSLLASALSYMCNIETSVSVPGKTFSAGTVTISTMQTIIWSAFVIVVLPLACVITGIVVYLRRKRV